MSEDVTTEMPVTKRKGGRPRKVVAAPVAAGVDPGMAALIEELRAARVEGPKAQAEAFAKIQNPSNVVASGCSVFNPRGDKLADYQMPRLKCEIHAPWKIHPEYHGLDREEVELFNLLQPGEYRIELNDQSTAKVTVRAITNDVTGKLEKMHVIANWTEEHKGKYPAMRWMLRQMIGPKSEAVMPIKQEIALIEAGELSVSV
jgi:hypothetical protein